VTAPGVLDACWARLRDGGRLVANAVTLQGESVLTAWRERHGGTLTRIALAHAQPLGGFDTWRQALPITMLEALKGAGGHTDTADTRAVDGAGGDMASRAALTTTVAPSRQP
jgi:precorrin-6Y C5,15-methyltransferase (decarboxylating)